MEPEAEFFFVIAGRDELDRDEHSGGSMRNRNTSRILKKKKKKKRETIRFLYLGTEVSDDWILGICIYRNQ